MKNLRPVPDDRDTLRFRDREEGDIVEIEVYYSKGTTTATRGVFFAIRPAHIAEDGTYSWVLFSGRSARVRALARSSPAVLKAVAAAADDRVAEVAAAYRDDPTVGISAFDDLAAALRTA